MMGKRNLSPGPILYPLPVVMVSCGDLEKNIITVAWAATLCTSPPVVGIGVRPSRYSHHLLVQTGEFVVNIPGEAQVLKADGCGMVSGKDTNKFETLGLTPLPAKKVRSPLVAECPVSLECRVLHRLPLGTHDLFLGEVVEVWAGEDFLDAGGRISWAKVNPLIYCDHRYWRLGPQLGEYGFSLRGRR